MAMKKPPRTVKNAPNIESRATEPVAGLPRMAAEFGLKPRKRYLPWSHAASRLEESRNYWIVTVGRSGEPHAMPVWGFWCNGAIYFGTARDSRKWRNLEANPKVVVHLESGDDVVVVEGVAREVTDKEEIAALRPLSEKKYGMWMPLDPKKHVAIAVNPRKVFAWSEKNIQATATKWFFFPDRRTKTSLTF
jgi:nitroimidazol reductase NimA-like FMN-containing flavoprotein (pyridoxamine 5'-phosphate oxidase superfamily)